MKKLCLVLLVALTMTLMGCATDNNKDKDNNDTTNENTMTWKDGTYTGEGDPWEYGSEDSTVTVKDGKMTEIELKRFDSDGKEVDYEMWTGAEIDGKTYPNLKQYRQDMAQKMIDAQSTEVDSIAGATVSCDNWKLATKRALDKAK